MHVRIRFISVSNTEIFVGVHDAPVDDHGDEVDVICNEPTGDRNPNREYWKLDTPSCSNIETACKNQRIVPLLLNF